MVTAHVDSDLPEQDIVNSISAQLDGLSTEVVMNVLLTLVIKTMVQVFGNDLEAANGQIDRLVPQMKTAIRMELVIQAEESRVN